MPIGCYERLESRSVQTQGSSTTVETRWFLDGSLDETEIRRKLIATAPPIYYDSITATTLYVSGHSVENIGWPYWDGTVTYKQPDEQHTGGGFSIDTTGGTVHITQSRGTRIYPEHPADLPPGETPEPDFEGAIGVTADGSVEGVDVGIPALKFSETHMIPAGLVTPAYAATLAGLTHKTNKLPWRTYPAESVIFRGATGQSQPDGLVPMTFQFEVGTHADNLTIGSFTGIRKKAWEYLWVAYQDTDDTEANWLVRRPKAVYVEEIYEAADYNLLGI